MRSLDLSSWPAVLSTLFGLAAVTLIGVGIRLLVMQTIQQRRERANRQINERLRTLIAAYKTLGGSFTGNLAVDPSHLRDLRRRAELPADLKSTEHADADRETALAPPAHSGSGSDRSRRVRDAVEAALSDVILLGTEEQVKFAANAANELAAGRSVHVTELVVSLRDFIRRVLDLDPVPTDLSIPRQGPARTAAARGSAEGGTKGEAKKGNVNSLGAGNSAGAGLGAGFSIDDEEEHHS